MALPAATVWRDYVTDGVPSSGAHRPRKSEVRDWAEGLEETVVSSLTVPRYETVAAAEAAAIDPAVSYLEVVNYENEDGWHRVLKRVLSEPLHPFKLQSDDGAWWESTAPRKFIWDAGQSNSVVKQIYSWSPAPNVGRWNTIDPVGFTAAPTPGTRFERPSASLMGMAIAFANAYAVEHPSEDVFLCETAVGATGIDQFMGGLQGYTFDSATVETGIADGKIRLNHASPASATQGFMASVDSFGAIRTQAWNLLGSSGRGIKIYKTSNPAVFATYSVPALPTFEAPNYRKASLTYVSGSGSFANGDSVRIVVGPDMRAVMAANLPQALAAAGFTYPDIKLWWQGENDAYSPVTYYTDYFTMHSLDTTAGYVGPNTQQVIYGIASSAQSALPYYDAFGDVLQTVLNADPDRRVYVNTSSLATALWDAIHMTGAGYEAAGKLGYETWKRGPGGVYRRAGTVSPKFGAAAVGITGAFTFRVEKTYRSVTLQVGMTFTSKGSSTGAFTVEDLPLLQPYGAHGSMAIGPIYGVASGVGDTQLVAYVQSSTNTLKLFKMSAGNLTQFTDADLTNTSSITLNGTYQTISP